MSWLANGGDWGLIRGDGEDQGRPDSGIGLNSAKYDPRRVKIPVSRKLGFR